MRKLFEKYPVWWVLLLMLACLAPVMALRDFSPANELRYLSIADEALRDGHLFAFYNQGVAYADKPPLYIWIIMLCRLIFGKHSMFALSMFSFVPAAVITLVMDRWVMCRRAAADRAAMAFMMSSTAMFLGMSVFLRMDMLMIMFDVLALYAFRRGRKDQFAVFTFLALFTKGPVGLLVPIVTAVVYILSVRIAGWYRRRKTVPVADVSAADALEVSEQSGTDENAVSSETAGASVASEGQVITRFGWWFGKNFWMIMLCCCAVWFLDVYLDGGKEYLNNLLFHQTVGRAVSSFHHSEPIWYYFVQIWPVLLPWSILCVAALAVSLFTLRRGVSEDERIFLCVILSTFVMLSCFSAKLSIYLAPIFPFAVYLVPMVTERTGWRKCMDWFVAVPLGVFALIGLVLGLAVLYLLVAPERVVLAGLRSVDVPWAGVLPFLGGAICIVAAGMTLAGGSISAIVALFRRKAGIRAAIPFATGLLLCVLMVSPLMPVINDYVGYGNLCREIPEGETVYVRKVYRPENMDVYLGRDVVKIGADDPIPEDGVLVTKAKYRNEALDGRKRIVHGEYAVYLPLAKVR